MSNLKGAVSLPVLGVIALIAVGGIALYMNPGLLGGFTQQAAGGSDTGGGTGGGGTQQFATNIRMIA